VAGAKYGIANLQVWIKAMELMELIHKSILTQLPVDERWGLRGQISRSSQSIPANIAEGFGRYYYQENIHFCYIARGSLEETFSHLTTARKLDYISEELFVQSECIVNDVRKLLNGYIEYLKKSKVGENEPGSPQTQHMISEIGSFYLDEIKYEEKE